MTVEQSVYRIEMHGVEVLERRSGDYAERTYRTPVAEARRLGVSLITVKPVARNVEAIKFFHRQGFKTLGYIELILDLSGRTWRRGPKLFDCQFYF